MATLTAMPEQFAAGTTVEYTKSLPDYSSDDGWTLAVYLAGPSATVTGTVAPSGSSFDVTLPASATDDLSPGLYRWTERVSKAGRVLNVASGYVTVTPDIATATAGEMLSFAEKQLAALEAEIAARVAGKTIESGQVGARTWQKTPLKELYELRAQMAAEVRQLRAGGRTGRTHLFEFRKPS